MLWYALAADVRADDRANHGGRGVGIAAAAMLAAAVALVYWRFGSEMPVPVVTVQTGRVPQQVVGPGTVQARIPVTLSARLTATLTTVLVDVGDKASTRRRAVASGRILMQAATLAQIATGTHPSSRSKANATAGSITSIAGPTLCRSPTATTP